MINEKDLKNKNAKEGKKMASPASINLQ